MQPSNSCNHSVLFGIYRWLSMIKRKLLPRLRLIDFPIMSKLDRLLRMRLLPKSVKIGEHTLQLDVNDSLKLSTHGAYEKAELSAMRANLRPGDTALDVGANIGYHTLEMARQVGSTGRVFAFEPAPDIFSLLKTNVKQNGYDNVVCEQIAASDQNGLAFLVLSDTNSGDNRLASCADNFRTVQVQTARLDDYLIQHKISPSFIKIDVQGFESSVFHGLRAFIENSEDVVILFEFEPALITANGTRPFDMLRFLTDRGFDLYDLQHSANLEVPIDIIELTERFTKKLSINLLAKRPYSDHLLKKVAS